MILVNLQLTIKPEVREEFIEWFYSVLPDTRAYEGCSELNACSLEGDPDAVEVISKWETKAHYEKYLAWREEDGTLGKLGAYLAADPVFRFLEVDLQI